MTIAQEVLDDVQLGETVALELIDLVVRLVGRDKASAMLDAAAIRRANAVADAVADAKFGP
jgi:hypothetical protein